jgi:hypothetical protein
MIELWEISCEDCRKMELAWKHVNIRGIRGTGSCNHNSVNIMQLSKSIFA